MPFPYKIQVKRSNLEGLGLFACEDIPKGAIWWSCDNNYKRVPCEGAANLENIPLYREQIDDFVKGKTPEELYQIFQHTMHYKGGNMLIYLQDGTGLLNHSFEPSCQIVFDEENNWEKMHSVTLRDIKAGEEITEDYSHYVKMTGDWVEEVFTKYVPSRIQFEKDFNIRPIQK